MNLGLQLPVENRNIYFTENEVKIALMKFSARKGHSFTTENISEFILNADAPISIALKVYDANTSKTGTVNYQHAEIAAALMGYCMFLKIPLPRAGKKSVLVKDNNLYLNVKIQ